MKSSLLVAAIAFVLTTGCTSVEVQPIASTEQISEVVIHKNPKVKVDDFVDVLVAGFQRHGIAAKIGAENAEYKDTYVVNYVAYRNWDMAPYLTDATISIDRNGRRVAEARYHLRGKGGLSMLKWEGTKTKIDPLIDELLKGLAPKS